MPDNCLYWYGNQVVALSETHGTEGSVTFGNYITIEGTSTTQQGYANVYSNSRIDFTGFTYLKVYGNAVSFPSGAGGTAYGLSSQQTNGNGTTGYSDICDVALGYFVQYGEAIRSLDLSAWGVSGSHYLRLFAGSTRKSYHYAIWLE